jgi:hypothetical protein
MGRARLAVVRVRIKCAELGRGTGSGRLRIGREMPMTIAVVDMLLAMRIMAVLLLLRIVGVAGRGELSLLL